MNFGKQYLTFDAYIGLGGNLDITPFNILEFKARKIVDKYTLGRLKNLETQAEEVKLCIFELINKASSLNESDNKGVASESIDGYSVSYESKNVEKIKAIEKEEQNIVETYLSNCYLENGIPYLYRGIEC